MKGVTLLSALLLLMGTSMAVDLAGQDVAVTFDVTYTSKYIWRGFDLLDDTSAWQPSVNMQWANGFGANVWASYPGSGGTPGGNDPAIYNSRVDMTEYNYTLTYSGSILENCYQTDYTIGWRYYDFIDTASEKRDLQEVFAEIAMPNLLEGGIVPHAAAYQMWSAQGGSDVLVRDWTGTIYVLGFNYGWTFEQAPEMPMTFMWDIVYNDGTGGNAIDHDWSHMVWGLKTSLDCPFTGGKLVPAIYFQNSFDDSVNTEDELWGGISYSITF